MHYRKTRDESDSRLRHESKQRNKHEGKVENVLSLVEKELMEAELGSRDYGCHPKPFRLAV